MLGCYGRVEDTILVIRKRGTRDCCFKGSTCRGVVGSDGCASGGRLLAVPKTIRASLCSGLSMVPFSGVRGFFGRGKINWS